MISTVGEYARSKNVKPKVITALLSGAGFSGAFDPKKPLKKKQLTHLAKLTDDMRTFLESEFEGDSTPDDEGNVPINTKKLYRMEELPSRMYAQSKDGTWQHRGAKGDDGLAEVIYNGWALSAPWVEVFKKHGVPHDRNVLRVEIGNALPVGVTVSPTEREEVGLKNAAEAVGTVT